MVEKQILDGSNKMVRPHIMHEQLDINFTMFSQLNGSKAGILLNSQLVS